MFQKTQYQFLLSYLAIFTALLAIFGLAVRFVFTHSLSEKLTENLMILGQNAASSAEFDKDHLQVENDFPVKELINHHQALQWFDVQGHLVLQHGQCVLTLPLTQGKKVQDETINNIHLRGVTLPVIDSEHEDIIGYVRASESLEEFDETLRHLDWGLGSGVVLTLALSCVGGVWLTRKAMQPIEQSFLRLKQFTADASHELRSPLMAITANVEVALEYPEQLRPKDIKKFKAIASAADQMIRLVEDLLVLARSDQVENFKREVVNLEEMLHNLVELYQPQADAKEINLKANLSQQMYILGDSVQLTRIFRNLIDNALQYTPKGGTVEVQTTRSDQQVYVKVKDTGIGMTREQLQQVFERFWRADKARSYHGGGFGLGLAIAKSLVQNHGGTITVTSQLDIGSCFSVTLNAY